MTDRRQTGITEEDLMNLGDRIEIVNGEPREKDMAAGFQHGFVVDNVYDVLKPFAKERRLGYVVTDSVTYILHVDEAQGIQVSRIPDLSFLRRGRIPDDFDVSRPSPGAPDLAVEVISPTEKVEDIEAKVNDYLTYGVEQVWLLYPASQTVHQYRQDEPNTIRVYRGDEPLDVTALFPGLVLAVSQFFVMPEPL